MVGRVSNLWVINILRRYDNSDGSFGGVVTAGITIDHLSGILRGIDLGPYSVDSIWSKKHLIARNAKNDLLKGNATPLTPVPQLRALIESGSKKTVYHTAGTVDGLPRLVNARKIGNYPLYLAVGLADRDFLQRWQQDSIRLAGFAALFTLASTLLTWLAVRSERRRHRLTRKLNDEERRFRSVFDNANDGIFIQDDATIIDCNPRAAELFGFQSNDVIGKTPGDLSPEFQPDGQRSSLVSLKYGRAALEGQAQRFEWQFSRADGTLCDVEIALSRLDIGGRAHLQAIARDITARKLNERRMAELNERLEHERSFLKTLVNTIPELIWLKDVNGHYLTCNPAFEKFFGHTESEIMGKTDFDFVDADLARSYEANDKAAIDAGGVSCNEEWVTYATDGHRALLRTCKTPMCSATGSVQGVLAISHDITQREIAEQALQSSLYEKEALLMEVHHRVKNNLQIISSLIRLEAGRNTQSEVKSVLSDMQGRIRSMALLHELLYRSQSLAQIDIGQYLRQLALQVFSANVSKRSPIDLKLDIMPVLATMDQAIPCGLLVNELVTNALKHGFPGSHPGNVWVELLPVDDHSHWKLSVSDNGVGLPEDFETRRQSSLGLQLASGLASQLGGELSVGPGAKFSVNFSIAKHAPAVAAA